MVLGIESVTRRQCCSCRKSVLAEDLRAKSNLERGLLGEQRRVPFIYSWILLGEFTGVKNSTLPMNPSSKVLPIVKI